MPLIEEYVKPESRGRITFKPRESSVKLFRALAEFRKAAGDLDWVFDRLMTSYAAKDAEFAAYLREHPNAGEVAQKPRRGAAADKAVSAGKPPAKSGEPTEKAAPTFARSA